MKLTKKQYQEIVKIQDEETASPYWFDNTLEKINECLSNKTKFTVGKPICLKNDPHCQGVIISSSDVGFNHWWVKWKTSGETIREYGGDLVVIKPVKNIYSKEEVIDLFNKYLDDRNKGIYKTAKTSVYLDEWIKENLE